MFKKITVKFNNNTGLIFEKEEPNQLFWRTIEASLIVFPASDVSL